MAAPGLGPLAIGYRIILFMLLNNILLLFLLRGPRHLNGILQQAASLQLLCMTLTRRPFKHLDVWKFHVLHIEYFHGIARYMLLIK